MPRRMWTGKSDRAPTAVQRGAPFSISADAKRPILSHARSDHAAAAAARNVLTAGKASIVSRQRQNAGYFGYMTLASGAWVCHDLVHSRICSIAAAARASSISWSRSSPWDAEGVPESGVVSHAPKPQMLVPAMCPYCFAQGVAPGAQCVCKPGQMVCLGMLD
jgi:hypothetical protein